MTNEKPSQETPHDDLPETTLEQVDESERIKIVLERSKPFILTIYEFVDSHEINLTSAAIRGFSNLYNMQDILEKRNFNGSLQQLREKIESISKLLNWLSGEIPDSVTKAAKALSELLKEIPNAELEEFKRNREEFRRRYLDET